MGIFDGDFMGINPLPWPRNWMAFPDEPMKWVASPSTKT
jgi:hypothetical protein